jgi:hypothetical protein
VSGFAAGSEALLYLRPPCKACAIMSVT